MTDQRSDVLGAEVSPDAEREGFEPHGTLIFVLLMLLGYAIYWAYLWFIVVIERGGG
jgi:hypothetical protein